MSNLRTVAMAAVTIPVWLTAVLALAPPTVALVALFYGNQQHAAQMSQQRDQFAETLNHERGRQTQSLHYERERDDLAVVRAVLDDAASGLTLVDRRIRDVFYGSLADPAKVGALKEAGASLDELASRIAVRFGRQHEVTRAFDRCTDAALMAFGQTTMAALDLAKARLQMYESHQDLAQARSEFADAATRYAGVQLSPS